MSNEVLRDITEYNKGCEFHRAIFSYKGEARRKNR